VGVEYANMDVASGRGGRHAYRLRHFSPARFNPEQKIVAEPSRAQLDIGTLSRNLIANVEKVVVGKRQQIIKVLVAWYCEGHVLLEDVPGVAKTMLARAFAKSIGCTFKRVQCTPDLLPNDVTGGSIFNQKNSE